MHKQSRTCISVIKNRVGKLVMGGDRRSSFHWGRAETMDRPKISAIKKGKRTDIKGRHYQSGEILLGATGAGALCTLLVDILAVPECKTTDTDMYMYFQFRQALIKLLKNQGYADKDGNLILTAGEGAELVVGINNMIYMVNIDFESEDPMAKGGTLRIEPVSAPYATGCGGPSALPILIAKKKERGYNTKEDLQLAMEIAAEISPGCDNKIDYRSED